MRVTGLDRFIPGPIAREHWEMNIKGKPAPDSFLAGAALAGVDPTAAVVFQDEVAGVQAGPAEHFGYVVVGVNRGGQHAADVRHHGATIVVDDLAGRLGES